MKKSQDAIKRGRLIAEARKRLGMSQDQVAEVCDVTRAAVSEWELGKVAGDLQPDKALLLSGLLSIPREKLVSKFVLQQIENDAKNPDDLLTPIRGLVSAEAEHIALVWDRLDPSDPVRDLIAVIIDRLAATSPKSSIGN